MVELGMYKSNALDLDTFKTEKYFMDTYVEEVFELGNAHNSTK